MTLSRGGSVPRHPERITRPFRLPAVSSEQRDLASAGQGTHGTRIDLDSQREGSRTLVTRALLLLYIATIYIRPTEIVPAVQNLPLVQIVGLLCGASLLASLVLRPRRFWSMPDLFALAYWVAIGISGLVDGPSGAVTGITAISPALALFFLTAWSHESPKALRRTVAVWLGLTLILALSGVAQQLTGSGLGGITPIQGRIRGSGLFNDPNDLGLAFVMVLPVAMGYIMEAGCSLLTRLAGWSSAALLLWGIYLASSRGTALGAVVVIAIFAIQRYGMIKGIVPAAVLIGLLALAAPSRILQGDESAMESSDQRVEAWYAGLEMFKSAPLVGVGWDNFTDYHSVVAHNSYVHVLAEMGVLGLAAFCGLLIVCTRWSAVIKECTTSRHSDVLRRVLVTSAIGTMVCIAFLSRQAAAYLYIPFALCAAYGRIEGRRISWIDAGSVLVGGPLAVLITYLAIRILGA